MSTLLSMTLSHMSRGGCSAAAATTDAFGALIVPVGNSVPARRFVNTV